MLISMNIKKKITQQSASNKKADKAKFPLSATDHLQNQYKSTRLQIIQHLLQQPKIIQIRLKQWLKKFDQISNIGNLNKNRNLYASVLLIMLMKKSITHPFHKTPPQSSLPLLTYYQLSFEIRQELDKLKKTENLTGKTYDQNEESEKENINFSNIDYQKQQLKQAVKPKGKQKRGIQNRLFHKQFEQTLKINSELTDQFETQKEVEYLIRSSYNFLLKNQNAFQDKDEIKTLLNDLWNSGLNISHQ